MAKLRVHNLSMSLDGFVAGADQGVDNPLGVGGEQLHEWMFATRMWGRMVGTGEGSTGLDNEFAERGEENIGAHVMGRNMFGPIRGDWGDEQWRGWWGDDPPYHHDVFVLTHHARSPIPMEGGTTFHFVTDGIEDALARATEAAGGADVRLGGGAATVRQYLRAGLVDELHVAITPVLLGLGERLFDGLDDLPAGYVCDELRGSGAVTHAVVRKR
jgi:dihydrofolate reductase